MDSGSWIRKLREEKFLRAREIERLSRTIVEATGNQDYYVSHASLADIEAGAIPSIFKLFSLSCFLAIPYNDLLQVFGVNPGDTQAFTQPVDSAKTALVPVQLRESTSSAFRRFSPQPLHEKTNLFPSKSESWTALPWSLLKMDHERYRYAMVGSKDDAMDELLPAGSLAEVDTQENVPKDAVYQTLRDRPIYLIWHDDGYSCSWCQQDHGELLLVPHPASGQPVRRFKTPREATVIGRIVAAWVCFARHASDSVL